jgi:hypothetical protein
MYEWEENEITLYFCAEDAALYGSNMSVVPDSNGGRMFVEYTSAVGDDSEEHDGAVGKVVWCGPQSEFEKRGQGREGYLENVQGPAGYEM